MRFVYGPDHVRHRPDLVFSGGEARPVHDVADRAERIRRALEEDGGFEAVLPAEHGLEPVEAVHDPAMVAALETLWTEWRVAGGPPEAIPDTVLHPALREGMGPGPRTQAPRGRLGAWCFDTATPVVEGTYAAARSAVDVALTAADLVLDGERHAYGLCRPPGHHAARAVFGGYCYLNNAAIAAQHLLRASGERVAILDVDYHHGNGTQQIFYARGDVLYASLHGDPARAYPYFTGFAEETGAGAGAGATLNLPLPSGCPDEGYLAALDEALEAIAGFEGGGLVVSLGLDTFRRDPLGDLALTTAGYHEVGRRVGALGLPTVVLQEGGYDVGHLGVNVRAWLRGLEGREAASP